MRGQPGRCLPVNDAFAQARHLVGRPLRYRGPRMPQCRDCCDATQYTDHRHGAGARGVGPCAHAGDRAALPRPDAPRAADRSVKAGPHQVARRAVALVALAGCELLLARAYAQTPDLLQLVNALRAAGGACGATAPALVRRDSLDAVAAQLARGVALSAATRSVDDRMNEVQVFSFTGPRQGARAEALVASRFCAQLARPVLTAVGVFVQGAQSWIVLGEPYAPVVGLTQRQLEQRMLVLVNGARAETRRCGDKVFAAAAPVRWNNTLELAAAGHADDMAANDYFSHTGRDGSTPAQRVRRAGYRYRMTGENIAAGQMTPEQALAGWIRSPGHCANLMQAGYSEMAVAFAVNAKSRMGVYWVQQFGTPR